MGTNVARGNYYQQLSKQAQINEEQLDKLYDLLFIQKVKAIFYLAISLLIVGLLAAIVASFLGADRFEIADRYSTVVNIGSVFLFFGLIETFSFFIISLSLIREINRLIRRQKSALREAKAEFATA